MGKIIAICAQKGGSLKSAISLSVSSVLSKQGKKVLIVDGDPQANLTFSIGVDFTELEYTLRELMQSIIDFEFEPEDTKNVIVETQYGIDLLPASIYMADLELKLITATQREFIIKKALASVKDKYDYIFIDCPPTLGLFLVNYLTAADEALIPVSCDTLGSIGMGQLIQSINAIQKSTNPDLKICGALFTLYQRTKDANEVVNAVRNSFGKHITIFETMIPSSTEAKKAVSHRMPINVYNKNCSVTKAYENFVNNEFLPKEEGR